MCIFRLKFYQHKDEITRDVLMPGEPHVATPTVVASFKINPQGQNISSSRLVSVTPVNCWYTPCRGFSTARERRGRHFCVRLRRIT